MDKEKFKELLEEFCDFCGYELRDDYSGRCMYGNTCYGVVGDLVPMLTELVAYLCDNEGWDFVGIVKNARTDNMGYDTILYFPSVKGVEYEEED